jgi:hypothetical protein
MVPMIGSNPAILPGFKLLSPIHSLVSHLWKGSRMSDNDHYTESSTQSWFSRMGSAIVGVLVGFVLILAAFPVIFLNETRAVRQAQNLSQGLASFVEAPPSKINPDNDGKLIHLTGHANSPTTLTDPLFGVTGDYLRLARIVEMYQWEEKVETKRNKNLGGSETTTKTYTYKQVWAPKIINSDDFQKPEGHANPKAMKYSGVTFNAQGACVGPYKLSKTLLEQITPETPVNASAQSLVKAKPEIKAEVKLFGTVYYASPNPAKPETGDLKISFLAAPHAPVSIMAAQAGTSFAPFHTDTGAIELIKPGTLTAPAMIKLEEDDNHRTTWLFRTGGFLLFTIGFVLILHPLAVFTDILPFVGGMVRFGVLLISLVLACPFTLIAVSLGWLFARPFIAVPAILAAVAVVVVLFISARGRRSAHP